MSFFSQFRETGEESVNHKLFGVLLVGLASSVAACVDQPTVVEEEETSTTAQASHGHGPDPQDEMFAAAVADAMIDRLVALLFREFAVEHHARQSQGRRHCSTSAISSTTRMTSAVSSVMSVRSRTATGHGIASSATPSRRRSSARTSNGRRGFADATGSASRSLSRRGSRPRASTATRTSSASRIRGSAH